MAPRRYGGAVSLQGMTLQRAGDDLSMTEIFGTIFGALWGGISGFFWTITHLLQVFNWSEAENVFRFIYYGGSSEFFAFVMFVAVLVFVIGIFRPGFLWGVVRGIEGISNGVGRFAAWAGLIMVLQQIAIVFLQSIFRVADIGISPFGVGVDLPLGWYGDGLKFYNAMVVCLCCGYTFVQRGHVRVDLFYAGWGHSAKRIMDMIGTVLFMLPALILIWFYGWFYMWRHMINPPVNSTTELEAMLRRAVAFRWDVQTFAASPSGFNGYFLYKIMLVGFAALMILQAIGFFYRSWLEFREGPDAAGKYDDIDVLESHDADTPAAIAE